MNRKGKISFSTIILILVYLAIAVMVYLIIQEQKRLFNESIIINNTTEEVYEEIIETYTGTIIYDDKNITDVFDISLPSGFKNTSKSKTEYNYEYKNNDNEISVRLYSVKNFINPSSMMKSLSTYYSVSAPFSKNINDITWYNAKFEDMFLYSRYATSKDGTVYVLDIKYSSEEELTKYENKILNGIKLK